jgi:hypothetical protein
LGLGVWDLGIDLIALDVAILPPPAVRDQARRLSEELAVGQGRDRLVLDDTHLPHITLTQQFIRREELEAAFARVDEVLRTCPPLSLTVLGGGKGSNSVWMELERSPLLVELHERLMETLRGFERAGGTAAAFVDHDARLSDVVWVGSYRLQSSFGDYTPHITLGHATEPPQVDPVAFDATTIAACHLGRFCSCRDVLRSWELSV